MATFTMSTPSPYGGSAEQRLAYMETYLYQLVERLKITLSELDEDNMSENVNASSAAVESRIKALEKRVTALEEKTKSL